MFQDDVLYSLGMFAVAAWLFKMWLSDSLGRGLFQ